MNDLIILQVMLGEMNRLRLFKVRTDGSGFATNDTLAEGRVVSDN